MDFHVAVKSLKLGVGISRLSPEELNVGKSACCGFEPWSSHSIATIFKSKHGWQKTLQANLLSTASLALLLLPILRASSPDHFEADITALESTGPSDGRAIKLVGKTL